KKRHPPAISLELPEDDTDKIAQIQRESSFFWEKFSLTGDQVVSIRQMPVTRPEEKNGIPRQLSTNCRGMIPIK
ncbi:MAG: hypothetical protein J5944_06020, partial [Lentisphaeria bacterium]|nr:hypothetical protein [Lentisphaeria bacterium]